MIKFVSFREFCLIYLLCYKLKWKWKICLEHKNINIKNVRKLYAKYWLSTLNRLNILDHFEDAAMPLGAIFKNNDSHGDN